MHLITLHLACIAAGALSDKILFNDPSLAQ